MPKAKPISLHPLTFEEAMEVLLQTPTKTQRSPKKKPNK